MKFKAEKIQKIIEDEIDSYDFEKEGPYVPSLEYVLDGLIIPPKFQRYTELIGVGFRWLWAVWDDGQENSYQVVYDPRSEDYGLARRPVGRKYGRLIILGAHGGFISTLMSM